MRELIVLRHGESEGNARGLLTGREDFPLTARGRSQARNAAALLAAHRWPPDHVRSSPLRRCADTASIVCEELDVGPPATDEAFTDIDCGAATGRSVRDVRDAMPGPFARPVFEWRFEDVGGESREDLFGRVSGGVAALPRDGRVLLVTHGAVFKAVLRSLLGLDTRFLMDLRMCSVMRLARRRDAWAWTHFLHAEEWTGSVGAK